jgi:hypothetical protein
MIVSPVSSAFLFLSCGKPFWAGGGMNDPGAQFNQAHNFSLEIIHNAFGGNPRDSGGVEMQLSKEYQNNFFDME